MKDARLSWIIALTGLCLVTGSHTGSVAWAQGTDFDEKYLNTKPAQPDGKSAPTAKIQKQIDVDFVDRDLREVVEEIGRKVGRNILVAPGIEETVTVTLRDIPWLDAVKIIAKLTNCDIEEAAPNVLLLTQPPKVTIEFHDANVRTVLRLIAAYSGKNIIIAPEVNGKISLSLKDVHWLKALHSIVKTLGQFTVVEDGPDLLRVVPRQFLEQQLETSVLPLKFVRPSPRYQAQPPRSGAGGGGGGAAGGATGGARSSVGQVFAGNASTASADNYEQNFALFRALRGVINATSITDDSVDYDASTNSIIVRATKPTTDEIRTIISKVDVEPGQIFIEIRFISTADRNFFETGLKFSGGDLNRGLMVSGPFPAGATIQSSRFSDPFIMSSTGQQQQMQAGGIPASAIPQPVGTFPFIFGEGRDLFERSFRVPAVLDFTGLNATLNWIDSNEGSRILQEPTLFTLDNQAAVIFVGENVPYATSTNNNDINGNVSTAVSAGPNSPVSVGFSLFVEPHVVPETDKIMMTIIPRVNSLSGTSSPITGFDRFSFGTNNFIDLPRTAEQAVVTQVMVEDGQTAVLGGLLSESRTKREIRIPVLSDIPLLGPLFINKVDQKETRNLVIFVTPTIVRTRPQGRSLFQRIEKRRLDNDPIYKWDNGLRKKAKESTESKGDAGKTEAPKSEEPKKSE